MHTMGIGKRVAMDLSKLPDEVKIALKYAAFLSVTSPYEPDKIGITQVSLKNALTTLFGCTGEQEIRNAGAALTPLQRT